MTRQSRVLVVEDDPVVRELTSRLLEVLGYTVDAVSNGLVAIAAAESRRYDLVLMDCQMPLLDGFLTTYRLRARGETMPIIGYSSTAARDACLAAGMNDFLAKPATSGQFAKVLDRWLGGPPRS